MPDQRFGLVNLSARHMRSDKAIRFRPQRMMVGQRFRFSHIQPRGLEPFLTQGFQQRILINRRTATDIIENRSRLER